MNKSWFNGFSSYDYFRFRLLSDPLVACYIFDLFNRQSFLSFDTLSSRSCDLSHTGLYELSPNRLKRSTSSDIDWREKGVLN